MSEIRLMLTEVFSSIALKLAEQREALNALDVINHNHGDHMVEIFQVATRAAGEDEGASLGVAMERGAELLRRMTDNGSAQVYGRGLRLLAAQLRQRQIELENLLPVVQGYLRQEKQNVEDGSPGSGEVLKGLMAALAEWDQLEAEQDRGAEKKPFAGVGMGYLFGMGMAYLQAKEKGGDRLDVLSETIVSASPLGKTPYRHASGVIAVRALLQALNPEG